MANQAAAEIFDPKRPGTWMVFDSDWQDPPGTVVATFATEAEAEAFVRGPGNGYGWTVLHVPAPGWRRP